MKLSVPCMECRNVGRRTEFQFVEVREDNTYLVTCSYGHQTEMKVHLLKFEVLIDIGANAILDGYYREAVSSFNSSLERFYEFAIQVLLERSSASGASKELFDNCWKKVSSQSERQLGAFIFLWAYCLREIPELLSQKQVEFRNNVIHKGIIPTEEEALKYGNAVMSMVRSQRKQLDESFSNEVTKVTLKYLPDSEDLFCINEQPFTMLTSTLTSLTNGDKSTTTLDALSLCQKLYFIGSVEGRQATLEEYLGLRSKLRESFFYP